MQLDRNNLELYRNKLEDQIFNYFFKFLSDFDFYIFHHVLDMFGMIREILYFKLFLFLTILIEMFKIKIESGSEATF